MWHRNLDVISSIENLRATCNTQGTKDRVSDPPARRLSSIIMPAPGLGNVGGVKPRITGVHARRLKAQEKLVHTSSPGFASIGSTRSPVVPGQAADSGIATMPA
jgi:hypothetical protein